MAYIPLQIPPGVFKNGTEYQSKGRWNNSNLVRWFEGTIRPVGEMAKANNCPTVWNGKGLD